MPDLTRRKWNTLALGTLAAAALSEAGPGSFAAQAKPNSKIKGVQIGAQSYSFRDRPLDEALKGYLEVGLSCCELWGGHIEPSGLKRDELRKWRLTTPLSQFTTIGQKFKAAGVDLYAFNYSFRDDSTEAEIERGFQMARALGAKCLTSSAQVSVAKRVDVFARKYKLRVGMHNHSNTRPNEFATPDDFAKAMEGNSEYIGMNLDIGISRQPTSTRWIT